MIKKKNTGKKALVKLSHKLYADKDVYEKVHRHLRDINDTISDEDIEQSGADGIVSNIPEATKRDQSIESKKTKNGLTTNEEEEMYEEGEKITSPWNILDE